MNTGWWEIDIHGCYSLVKIAFAPICACKNNRWIWRHNAGASRSRDVTDQLWWRHIVKSEKTVLIDNGERSDGWLFVKKRFVCSRYKIACKKKNNTFVTVNNDFLVTREVICSWFSLVTSSLVKIIGKSPHSWPKIVIHGNSCIILYIFHAK